jgi:hypothetical protein
VRFLSLSLTVSAVAMFGGCSGYSFQLHPEAPEGGTSRMFIPCRIDYTGKADDLPSHLRHSETAACSARYTLRTQTVDAPSPWDWINPLHPLGISFGEESLTLEGKLVLEEGNGEGKIFTSTCTAERTFTLYSRDDDADPEKKCRDAIRSNLNDQLLEWKKKK